MENYCIVVIVMTKGKGNKFAQYLRREGDLTDSELKTYRRNDSRRNSSSGNDPMLVENPLGKKAVGFARELTTYSARGIRIKAPQLTRAMKGRMHEKMIYAKVTPTQALRERAQLRLTALRAQKKPSLPPAKKPLKLAGPRKRLP